MPGCCDDVFTEQGGRNNAERGVDCGMAVDFNFAAADGVRGSGDGRSVAGRYGYKCNSSIEVIAIVMGRA